MTSDVNDVKLVDDNCIFSVLQAGCYLGGILHDTSKMLLLLLFPLVLVAPGKLEFIFEGPLNCGARWRMLGLFGKGGEEEPG